MNAKGKNKDKGKLTDWVVVCVCGKDMVKSSQTKLSTVFLPLNTFKIILLYSRFKTPASTNHKRLKLVKVPKTFSAKITLNFETFF